MILVGDSAGGNLLSVLCQQLCNFSLPPAQHLVLNYPAVLCHMLPSPSRLVSLIDPIVMFPCLLRCINAYSDPDYKQEGRNRTFEQGNQRKIKSPHILL